MFKPKAFKHIMCATTAFATVIALAGCSNPIDTVLSLVETPSVEQAKSSKLSSSSSQIDSAALVEAGTLTVGLSSSSSAPMCITSETGGYKGYDIDVASALASELGLQVKFVQVSNLSASVGSACDVVMNISSSNASGLTVSGSYAEDATAFFTKGTANEDGSASVSASDISGKVVGVQSNSTSQQYLLRSDLNATQSTFSNLNEAFQALNDGSVDYVLCDALAGSYLAEIYSDINLVGTLDVPSTIGIATSSSNTALQTAVQEAVSKLNSNGVIEVIRDKWINGMQTLTSSSQITDVTISAGVVATDEGTENVSQDGSNAGANAVDIDEEYDAGDDEE